MSNLFECASFCVVNTVNAYFSMEALQGICSETTLTGESRFHIGTPLGIEPGSLLTGSKGLTHWPSETLWMQWDCRLSTGLPPSSQLCRLWSQKKDLQRAWSWDSGIITLLAGWPSDGSGRSSVQDEARLRRGHNDQSCQGYQCSETTLTGESWFHISTPLGTKPGSLMTGTKGLTHWTSETVHECSEIAGSPQSNDFSF